jgi:hypothetical protein
VWLRNLAVAILLTVVLSVSSTNGLYAQQGSNRPMAPSATEQVDGAGVLLRQTSGTLDAYRAVPFVAGELLIGVQGGNLQALQSVAPEVSAAAVQPLDLRTVATPTVSASAATAVPDVAGYVIQVPAGQEWATIERLLQDPTVVFAMPNWLVYAAEAPAVEDDTAAIAEPETPFTFNDPLYADEQWYLPRINTSRAWALAYGDDGFGGAFTEVQVAIVDSGIDVNHPEFRGHLLDGQNYVSPGNAPDDDFGHGTHVAGLIGAVANNAVGMAGVAPKVRIDPRKVLTGQGTGTIANVAQAIRDAADDGADIINLSLESSAPNVVMEAAVQYAASKGVLLIAAAGNFYPAPVSWPAAYDEVMAIAATTYNDTHASYSNAGPEVEIAAPGGERDRSIISTWPGGVRCRDINAAPPQSDYCTSEGTSMAAAVASGAAAMVKSLRPSLTAGAIRQLLRDTAHDVNQPANFVGQGRLDMQAALRQILPPTLVLSQNSYLRELVTAADPYTVTLRIDNPSSTALDWNASLLAGANFVDLHSAISGTISGTVSYGAPVYLSLTISPTHLSTGSHVATLQVTARQADGSRQHQFVDLSVLVWPQQALSYNYFPLVLNSTPTVIPDIGYSWEEPAEPSDRTLHRLFDNSNIALSLPFTFTLRGIDHTAARIYSDGFLRFPDATTGDNLPNRCLPNLAEPGQAIYGWWADLDPGAPGAQVSSFQPSADRFVVEFTDVPAAGGIISAYEVSFQIVLHRNGDVRLNYRQAPGLTADAPPVTVGIEAHDGLFFNQVACNDTEQEIGYLPESQQSILFHTQGDVY